MTNQVCLTCHKRRDQIQKLIELPHDHGYVCNECVSLWADICGITQPDVAAHDRRVGILQDIKDITLPKTTKEFAQYLRDIATQVDRISDRPLFLEEEDVEVGFYYGNPMFPQKPTGLHFAIDFATTEYTR